MLETERSDRLPAVEAVTRGVKVSVVSKYLPHQSAPANNRFVFSYEVTITNEGKEPVQLKTRHWIITDAHQKVEEVRGEGVVGEKPKLDPGQSFQYTSGCILKTTFGTMHGTYQMYRDDGTSFDAEIPAFLLAAPFSGAGGPLN